MPWKDDLSEKIALEYDLSWIHVSLSRICDLNPRRKMKDDLFQKYIRKCDIFFRSSEKMVFSKRAAPEHHLSCIIWKVGIFFPANTIFFPWAGSQRWPLSRNTWKYIFCVHMWVLQTWCHAPLPKKNQGWPYPAKMHLKVIDVRRKSSRNSLYLHRDLYGRFHVLLSSKKTQET